MSIATPPAAATLDDLARMDGKAELVAGRIVRSMPNGELPSAVAFEIAILLREYARQLGHGRAYTDGLGYALPAPLRNGRQSFSPDVSFYTGPLPTNRMRFIVGVPDFAVEVRSENDYSPAALREMALKRADYFEAGTLVVWDVDPVGQRVAAYRAEAPDEPTLFRSTDEAHAEPALPGWRVPVTAMFV